MNSYLVPVHAVDQVWPLISERIIAAVEKINFDCSAGELWQMCRAQGAFLIVSEEDNQIKGASVWRFETWVKGPVFRNIILAGDDISFWKDSMAECAERVARAGGAGTYTFAGREGWGRLFPDAKIQNVSYIMKV
jgi:hypothetical protein